MAYGLWPIARTPLAHVLPSLPIFFLLLLAISYKP
jgi:hypothetical protein